MFEPGVPACRNDDQINVEFAREATDFLRRVPFPDVNVLPNAAAFR